MTKNTEIQVNFEILEGIYKFRNLKDNNVKICIVINNACLIINSFTFDEICMLVSHLYLKYINYIQAKLFRSKFSEKNYVKAQLLLAITQLITQANK